MTDWLNQLWDTLTSVSVPLLILGLVFQTAQTAFVALAWRNILRGRYPYRGGERPGTTLGYYAGGRAERDPPGLGGDRCDARPLPHQHSGIDRRRPRGRNGRRDIFSATLGALVYLWLFLGVADRSKWSWARSPTTRPRT